MKYKMEELVPLVAELTEKYTGFESTSVTYEKAEQLMGAVLYCIRETECGQEEALASEEKIPARRAYKLGYELVKQKVELALQLYHEIFPAMLFAACRMLWQKGCRNSFNGMISGSHPRMRF